MSLNEYQRKRKPETPEPFDSKFDPNTSPIFVVQKHNASHLHYDFRLEVAGVLKSWAVPKGPSLNPADKRMAIMVEDHPLEYQNFEGVIPKGNYGAGQVIIWDRGTYEAKDLQGGLTGGKISLRLFGKKLNGEFALTKIKSDPEGKSWLLIKKNDEFASSEDIRLKDQSVLSGKTIEDLKTESERVEVEQLKQDPPEFIEPMLARLGPAPFDKSGWIFEIKWDGYRAIGQSHPPKLYSRNQLSFAKWFPTIFESLKKLKMKVLLDGEIVILDENGKPNFGQLQEYRKTGGGFPIYYVFDLLFLDDFDTRELPLRDRRELLEKLFAQEKMPSNFRLSPYAKDKGVKFFQEVIAGQELEGMVAKNFGSAYKSGKRSEDWLKVKRHQTQEAIICGASEGKGSRRLGALTLCAYQNGKLREIGHAGTGFDNEMETRLLEALKKKEILVCEVRFSEWTRDGLLRHPVFLRLRPDKKPTEAVVEIPTEPPKLELLNEDRNDKQVKAGQEIVIIKNFRKKLWPEEGYRKIDLVNYYQEIAAAILPHLRDRPESLHRFPHGILDEGFYQKDTSELNLPPWVESAEIFSESNQAEIRFLLCQNEETLVYMANLGCLEINPWNSRVGHLDSPDYLVIDLDPLEVPFSEVVRVTQEAKKILDQLKVKAYCKTSGATGLHIYIPLGAKYSYDQARTFSQIIANLLHAATREVTSLERSPGKRNKKIYLDYLQNKRGQTLAAAYSPRPLPGAPVSTPLLWEELTPSLRPTQFTIKNIPERIKDLGDIWRPVLDGEIDLTKILRNFHLPKI